MHLNFYHPLKSLKMRNKLIFSLAFVMMVSILIFVGCGKESFSESDSLVAPQEMENFKSQTIDGQYIIVLKNSGPRAEIAPFNYEAELLRGMNLGREIAESVNIEPSKVVRSYAGSIQGFVIKDLKVEELNRLKRNESIEYIEQDQTISIYGGPPGGGGGGSSCASSSNETVPCGINAVNGGSNYTGSHKAYVLDSGIDLDHEDLNVAGFGYNAFTSGKDSRSLNDENGHGTHCAGTIAAIGGNSVGVVGVAAGALLVPVKVLDRNGSGSISGVIAGVDYVGVHASAGDVANMSLGGGASSALDNAVVNASSGGVWFVVAAGNNSANANNYSPARANGAYVRTISSMTCSGTWSSFSNFGAPPVDWIAPGSGICSTYKDGGYASLSGTSMAAPHAAGVILLRGANPNTCGSVSHSSGSYPRICN